jgi:hypothetical protein
LAPLWDDNQGAIVGMLTASDFVLILRKVGMNYPVFLLKAFDNISNYDLLCSCRETFELLATKSLKCIPFLLGKKQNFSIMSGLMVLPCREGH